VLRLELVCFVSFKTAFLLETFAYLNSFSSSITCMPCSYCSCVGASPTEAKWPFMVVIEDAVGNLDAVDGLLELWPFV